MSDQSEACVIEKQIAMHIPARKAITYPIKVGLNLLSYPETWLPENWRTKRVVIITDDNVNKIYGEKLSQLLRETSPLLLSFLPGEQSKNAQIKLQLEEQMLQAHCDRETLILALGGGVVGDMAGFIAATYMRGVSYIQIPTTLLAMVDSSVGGKTSINLPQGKNLVGAFWQPSCVVADINCLSTLQQEHLVHGFIEAIKMFLTHDADYFNYAYHQIDNVISRNTAVLKNIIQRAIQIKVDVVSADEQESNQRMILNFGHTIGHALEAVSAYTLLHGYAVALGILVEATIAKLLGILSGEDHHVIRSLLLKLNISGNPLKEIEIDRLIQATKTDKKIRNNQVRYVLLKKIGTVYYENGSAACFVSDEIVAKALQDVRGGV